MCCTWTLTGQRWRCQSVVENSCQMRQLRHFAGKGSPGPFVVRTSDEYSTVQYSYKQKAKTKKTKRAQKKLSDAFNFAMLKSRHFWKQKTLSHSEKYSVKLCIASHTAWLAAWIPTSTACPFQVFLSLSLFLPISASVSLPPPLSLSLSVSLCLSISLSVSLSSLSSLSLSLSLPLPLPLLSFIYLYQQPPVPFRPKETWLFVARV